MRELLDVAKLTLTIRTMRLHSKIVRTTHRADSGNDGAMKE
jgi:hypothetical protein